MVRKLVLAVTAASALMSSNMALALGVGDINLRSALNQPLEAEIELLQVKDLSSEEILPTLASADDFGRAGIDRAFFLTDLNFTPEIKPDGRAVIKVTSSRPVNEPFLNFLMEVRWPSGRVLREFTVLLDPPLYQTSSAPVTAAAPVTPPSVPRQQASAPSRQTQQAPAARPAQQQAQSAPASTEGGTLRTNPSDTLWELALAHRPQGASVHQTMLAIQDLNPQAFLNNNINTMLANQTLTLPDAEQAGQRSRADALDQVAQQTSTWQSGRKAAEPTQRQLDARQRDTAAAAPAEPDTADALRLVAGSEEGGGSDSAGGNGEGQLRDALDRTKEQLDSAESEKAELATRLDDVQGQLETLQRLLTLKDTQLAALQEQMGSVAAQDAGAASAALQDASLEQEEPVDPALAETAEPVLAGAESEPVIEQDEAALADEGNTENEAVTSADAPVAQVSSIDEPLLAEPIEQAVVSQATTTTPAEPAESTEVTASQETGVEGMLQRFLQNQTLMLIAGAAALFILLLILMAISRRNARREQELSDNFLGSAVDADIEPGAHESEDFNVALAHFAKPEDEQPVERDVITEADGLIAYGKLAEAAEALRSAIDQEPGRTDLRLKLMEVEALQEHPQSYAEQAEAVEHLGGADKQLEDMHARFPAMAAGLLGASMVISDFDENDFDLDLDTSSSNVDETSDSLFDEEPRHFDFGDLDEPPTASADSLFEDEKTESDAFDLDFDLDDSLAAELAKPDPIDEAAASGFSLDLDDELDSSTELSAFDSDNDDSDLVLPSRVTDDTLTEFDVIDPLETESSASAEEAKVDQPADDFGFSDADLADFETEMNASVEAETEAAEAESADRSSLTDALDPFTGNIPTDQAMSESMEDEFDFLSGTDECATKLDLARAYVDMGDEEGARDILAEVMEEGNDQQQKDAREMMEQLA